jgi:hypothetical protein
MEAAFSTPNTSVEPQAASARATMERIARALGVTLEDTPDPLIAVVIDNRVAVNIAVHGERVAAFCRIADVSQMTSDAWVAMLAEAASWGFDGESARFAVMKPFVALLWSAPLAESADALIEPLQNVLSRAVEVARMVRRLAKASDAAEA